MVHGRLNRLAAVAANTFRETVRERVLYNLVFFAVLMTLSSLVLGQISIRQDRKIIVDLGLASTDIFGTLIAIFMGVGLVSKEIDRRSLFPLLAKPLSRDEFFLGKMTGLALTLLVNTMVMGAGTYVALAAAGHQIDAAGLSKGVGAIYLSLLLVVALAMFLSTLTSSTLAAIGTVALVLAGRFSDLVRNMRQVAPSVPQWVTTSLYWALPNFNNFDFKDRVAYGDVVPVGDLAWVGLYTLTYVGILVVGGLWLFRRRDLA